MNHEPDYAAHLRRTLKSLLHINETLLDRLERVITADDNAGALSAEESAALATVYKHVLMVSDFETQLLKRGYLDADGPREALDLDAARREVAGRLGRIEEVRHQRSAA